ncbi:MATE efflux family protein [Janthinobacterium sp. HH01]|uniref:MATE family efflux transporter n=1 Tax=Janthinobacterium sp. HH01 TaxID=1198452 RepID=UPI0002AEA69D|nr:MATE family efflux transporter [Janthinobacterium sp. HH01]ELX11415.1 MATE efflux family protein [Janthinobacterium sp. HH01]
MKAYSKPASIFALLRLALRGGEQEFTEGSINRAIFLLSVPMILEMATEALFAIVDVFYVSLLRNNDALAIVVLTESMLTLVYSVAMGLGMGATALVARRIGEKDRAAAAHVGAQAIYLGLGVSLLVGAAGLFGAEHLLQLMGADQHIIDNYAGYTRWMLTANITIMMLFIINGVLRGAGDAAAAMRALLIANGLNLLLDPLFIFGLGPVPALGVEGAAIATNVGRATGVLYLIYHLGSGKSIIAITAGNFRPDPRTMLQLLKVAAGATAQFLIGSASWIFLVRIMAPFGSAALAGYTIAIRVIVFAILPSWGMANAAATLVGQNLGAGKAERAEKSVWRTGFINMLFLAAVTVLFLLFARDIVGWFTVDEQVLLHGTRCLQFVSAGYIFYAYGMVINQSFNGAGDTRTPTILSFVGFWLFQIPFAYFMAKSLGLGPDGVYIAIVTAETAMAIAGILLFRMGKWKVVRI